MSPQGWTTDTTVQLACIILLSAGTAACASPWGRRLAWSLGAIDRPDARKIHQHVTARLGGLSAAVALLVCLGLWLIADPLAFEQCQRYWGLFPGAAIMFLLGLWDDVYGVRPPIKLAFQCLAGIIIWCGGIRIEVLQLPAIGMLSLAWASPVITILWIVGVINAVNFLDGLDGLAAGTAALAASSFLLISDHAALGSILALLSMVLIGACAVLIVNNFRSPKLFLGDSGSLLLGVLIASMAILAAQLAPRHDGLPQGTSRLSLSAIILAVPLIDMVACAIRRVLVGRSIFSADRGHIHHMLLAFGFSPAAAMATLCGATAIFGLLAAVAARGPAWVEIAVLAGLAVLSLVVYRRFGYLSLNMWLHCRRANRILARLIAKVRRPEARPADQTLDSVLNGIRRARRTLGIEYIRLQENVPGTNGQGHALLEIGSKPTRVVTTRVFTGGRRGGRDLTITLGEGVMRRPARIHAKELLLMPLLLELSAALGLPEMQIGTPAATIS